MLVYVALILLPAMALAVCDRPAFQALFDVLDTDGSKNVSREECNALFAVFDPNGDGTITLEEIEAQAPIYAAIFVGHEPALRDFIDHNSDKVITKEDIVIDFKKVDTDKDGFKSLKEFQIYIIRYCFRRAVEQLLWFHKKAK